MAIEDWGPTLASRLAEVEGLVAVRGWWELPAAIQELPSGILLPRQGDQSWSQGGGDNVALHDMRLTVYFANQILPEGYAVAAPFIKLVRNKLAGQLTLGNLVSHIFPLSPFYEGPGGISYGDDQKNMLGIHFYFQVKEHETFTVAP